MHLTYGYRPDWSLRGYPAQQTKWTSKRLGASGFHRRQRWDQDENDQRLPGWDKPPLMRIYEILALEFVKASVFVLSQWQKT